MHIKESLKNSTQTMIKIWRKKKSNSIKKKQFQNMESIQ
jgi:hypothetical protein